MPALIALIPGWSQRRLPFTSSTRSLDCQADWLYAGISDSRDSQGTRFPSPPISYLTSIPFMLHSAIGFSCLFVSWALLVSAVGCVVLWPALRSLSRAWLFRCLAWFCCRSLAGPVSRSVSCGFPLGPQLVSPSLVSPSVLRSWLFFSAIGHLLGRWLSLPVDGRGVGCVSSRSLVRLGLGSLYPPALLSVLPVGFVLRCYLPEPAKPERKERDGPRQGPRRRPRRCYDHDAGDAGDGHDAGDNHDADPFLLWIPRRRLPDRLFSFKVHNFHFVLHIS